MFTGKDRGLHMDAAVVEEIETLAGMDIARLLERYRKVFGERSRCSHKEFLVRRIAWKLQARAEGDLSEAARRRAIEIVCDSDLRVTTPKGVQAGRARRRLGPLKDNRIPIPGTELRRRIGNRDIIVKVLATGFEFNQRRYTSLSAIAREVTGTRWNGLLFFGLTERRRG